MGNLIDRKVKMTLLHVKNKDTLSLHWNSEVARSKTSPVNKGTSECVKIEKKRKKPTCLSTSCEKPLFAVSCMTEVGRETCLCRVGSAELKEKEKKREGERERSCLPLEL